MTSIYTKWFRDTIEEYRKYAGNDFHNGNPNTRLLTFKEYLNQDVYFVTITYKQSNIIQKNHFNGFQRGTLEFKNLSAVYNKITKMLCGGHYNSPNHKGLPLCIAAIDSENTKYAKNLEEIKNLHIHCVMMPPKADEKRFKSIILNKSLMSRIIRYSDIDQIDVQNFSVSPQKEEDLLKVLSYMQKSIRLGIYDHGVSKDLEIYPKQFLKWLRP